MGVHSTLEGSLAVSYKTQHTLTIGLAVVLPDIYPEKLKTYIYTKTCTQMFIAALFIIVGT